MLHYFTSQTRNLNIVLFYFFVFHLTNIFYKKKKLHAIASQRNKGQLNFLVSPHSQRTIKSVRTLESKDGEKKIKCDTFLAEICFTLFIGRCRIGFLCFFGISLSPFWMCSFFFFQRVSLHQQTWNLSFGSFSICEDLLNFIEWKAERFYLFELSSFMNKKSIKSRKSSKTSWELKNSTEQTRCLPNRPIKQTIHEQEERQKL